MTKPVWINTDNEDGYDVHGPGGYWVGGTAWWITGGQFSALLIGMVQG